MHTEPIHAVWLNGTELCSIEHLADLSGLSLDDIEDLIATGLIEPAAAPLRRFHLVHVVTLRQARRLRDDFQLDRHGLSLAMALLRRIESLEQALLAQRSGGPGARWGKQGGAETDIAGAPV